MFYCRFWFPLLFHCLFHAQLLYSIFNLNLANCWSAHGWKSSTFQFENCRRQTQKLGPGPPLVRRLSQVMPSLQIRNPVDPYGLSLKKNHIFIMKIKNFFWIFIKMCFELPFIWLHPKVVYETNIWSYCRILIWIRIPSICSNRIRIRLLLTGSHYATLSVEYINLLFAQKLIFLYWAKTTIRMYFFSQENLGPEYAAALQEIRDKDRGNNIVFSSRVNSFAICASHPSLTHRGR